MPSFSFSTFDCLRFLPGKRTNSQGSRTGAIVRKSGKPIHAGCPSPKFNPPKIAPAFNLQGTNSEMVVGAADIGW
jgi:hypothetical protein